MLSALLWYDHQVCIGNKNTAALKTYTLVLQLVPLFVHQCSAHVNVANGRWIMDKDRTKKVSDLGDDIAHLVKHVAKEMTSLSLLSDTITLVSSIIAMLRLEEI